MEGIEKFSQVLKNSREFKEEMNVFGTKKW